MGIELSETQKQTIRKWAEEGCGLSEIQKRMSSELGISATFMDVRFLAIEMGLQIKDKAAQPPGAADLKSDSGPADADERLLGDEGPTGGGAGGVSVQVDRVMKPGSLVSGTVTFSDGVSAAWALDQFGRLAISAGREGYKPAAEDLQAFQMQLRSALESRGY